MAGGINFEQACKDDPALVEWVRAMAPRVRRVASICTGAFILAAAGLLNHRRVTTHWQFSELLAKLYPSVQVDFNLLFARDGNIYTSGGITAGIDLALTLVEEDRGREITLAVARTMVVFPRRPGGQSQFSAFLMAEAKNQPDIRELLGWILGHPGEDLGVPALADRMGMSRAISRGCFAARPERRRHGLPNGRGPRRPAANSNKPLYRSRPSLSDAASAMPNACGAPFSAFSISVRRTTGLGFDRPCLLETLQERAVERRPLNKGRRGKRLCDKVLAVSPRESLLRFASTGGELWTNLSEF